MKLTSAKLAILTTMFATSVVTTVVLAQPVHTSAVIAAAKQDSSQASVSGKWKLSFTDPTGNAREGVLDLQQDGSRLTGRFTGPRRTLSVKGDSDGNRITFAVSAMGRKLTFSGSANGDKMSGTTETGATWSASRE
ncbi:hypothetical protein JAO29_03060 [Edaphobacter sp. HDX4]|uniref:hypothetical protein n=1 Tax=Edaphobacter sp. HDX4 TaxID=2794064 RepID=UPI002FE65D97